MSIVLSIMHNLATWVPILTPSGTITETQTERSPHGSKIYYYSKSVTRASVWALGRLTLVNVSQKRNNRHCALKNSGGAIAPSESSGSLRS